LGFVDLGEVNPAAGNVRYEFAIAEEVLRAGARGIKCRALGQRA